MTTELTEQPTSKKADITTINVLIVEDNPGDVNLIKWMLTKSDPNANRYYHYELTHVELLNNAIDILKTTSFDVILLDLLLPDSSGMQTFSKMQSYSPHIPIIVLSGFDDESKAIQAVREGAQDYLTKGQVDGNILKRSIKYAIERKHLEEERTWETSVNAALTDLSEAIIISNSIQDISSLFAEQSKYFTHSSLCIVCYRKDQGQKINCIISDNTPIEIEKIAPQPVTLDEPVGLVDRVFSSKQPILLNLVSDEKLDTNSILDEYELNRFLAVPATIGDRVVGSIILANADTDYSPKDLQYAERLSALFAIALQRQNSLDALKASEERYRVVSQSAKDAIISIDAGRKIISWNSGAESIFQFKGSEINGKMLDSIIPEIKNDPFVLAPVNTTSGNPHTINRAIEISGQRKNGEEFPMEMTFTGWSTTEGQFYTAIIRDISHRKTLEKQFRQAQKMEAVGQLAGGIAHDFNNILTGIIGFAELAVENIEADTPEKSYIESIIRKSDHAATLVRQILAFSRKQMLDIRQVDLNQSIVSISNFIERVIGEHIEFSTNLDGDLSYISADSTAVEQILTNLCVNSRDAMPDGGQLKIETTNIVIKDSDDKTLSGIIPGKYSVISVSDNGHGMETDTIQHIFEPFFTTKEIGQGSGLGLAMVYGLVKQHDAFITCQSEIDKGTTFKIYFPSIEPSLENNNSVVIDQVKGGNETILMVEDEIDLIIVSKSILEQYGYTVLTAGNGLDGFKVFKENQDQIKLVITDIVMPKEGGIELYQRIKAERSDIKFLFITGYASGLADKEMIIGNRNSVLTKPYRKSDLAGRVRQVLDFPEDDV